MLCGAVLFHSHRPEKGRRGLTIVAHCRYQSLSSFHTGTDYTQKPARPSKLH